MTGTATQDAGEGPPTISVTVTTWFPGAGDTTPPNHILTAEHGRRLGVLVNDFGAINVDAELVTEVGDGMVALANGRICCTIRMDLIRAALQMVEQPERPEHIVIVSSVVAAPASVIKSFLEPGIWGTIQLDGVITVVDAEQAPTLPTEERKLADLQVAGAGIVALNKGADIVAQHKIDLVDAPTLKRVHAWINTVRPGVQVFETTRCTLPMGILLGLDAADPRRVARPELGVHVHDMSANGGEHRRRDHDLMFDMWSFTTKSPVRLQMMQQVLPRLPSTVFRVNGCVHSREEPQSRLVLQLVGRRATITPSSHWGAKRP